MSIKIKKCPTSNTKEFTKDEYLTSVAMHVSDVQKGCAFIANKIIEAGINHDYTKISLADDFMDDAKLSGDEFRAGKWFQAHITKERHHFDKWPDNLNLIDVIECLVDVTMAATARSGDIKELQMDSEILQEAFKNTFEMLKKEIVIEED